MSWNDPLTAFVAFILFSYIFAGAAAFIFFVVLWPCRSLLRRLYIGHYRRKYSKKLRRMPREQIFVDLSTILVSEAEQYLRDHSNDQMA